MKKSAYFFAVLASAFLWVSCSDSKDEILNNTVGNGNLRIEFDNAYAGNDLILGAPNMPSSQGETLQVQTVKYIVSNIELTTDTGQTFVYPKADSYFIVNESQPSSLFLSLPNIPAGNYAQIRFGIGVDEAQWQAGADGQGDLLLRAEQQDMFWSWSAGYKFIAFEGNFTGSAGQAPFMIHTGKTGSSYNYASVTLPLPQKALVRAGITPEIHVVADLSQIIDGPNKIKLQDSNTGGMGAMIMSGDKLPQITQNLGGMFHVDHVHND